jgi:hypothetical protein
VHAFKGTQLECIDPWEVFNRRTSLVMAIEMARRLTGWSAFKADPTWLTLRTGWGSPTEMDDPDAIDRMAWAHNKFADRLEQIGVDPDFMFEPVTALPARDPVGLLQHLNVL